MPKETIYHFHIAIPIRLIGPLTELLAQDGLLLEMKHDETEKSSAPPPRPKAKRFPRPKGGPTGASLVLESLLRGPHCLDELCAIFQAKGRHSHSASSTVSQLVKQGKIEREVRPDGRTWLSLPGTKK